MNYETTYVYHLCFEGNPDMFLQDSPSDLLTRVECLMEGNTEESHYLHGIDVSKVDFKAIYKHIQGVFND